MMKTRVIVILLFLAQLAIGTNLFAETVNVYCLKAMPFCGVIDGKPSGIAIDILNEATKHGAPNFKFTFDMPWKRAMFNLQKAEKNELVAIIPFTRSSVREDKFKWVAEIMATHYRFYTYGRVSPIKSIDEIKDEEIGAVFGHAVVPMLEEMGFKVDSGAKTAKRNAMKLFYKRFKVMADSDVIALYYWKEIGQKAKDLQQGPSIGDAKHVYIATGLNFPDDIADSIFKAIEKMRGSGKLQEIYDKWL